MILHLILEWWEAPLYCFCHTVHISWRDIVWWACKHIQMWCSITLQWGGVQRMIGFNVEMFKPVWYWSKHEPVHRTTGQTTLPFFTTRCSSWISGPSRMEMWEPDSPQWECSIVDSPKQNINYWASKQNMSSDIWSPSWCSIKSNVYTVCRTDTSASVYFIYKSYSHIYFYDWNEKWMKSCNTF